MSALKTGRLKLQLVLLLLPMAVIVIAVLGSWSDGSDGWVTTMSAQRLARTGVVLDAEHSVFLVQTSGGPIALNRFGDYRGGEVVYCESSELFEGVNAGSKFDKYGYYLSGPAPASLRRYPTRIEDGMVQVQPYEPLPRVGREDSEQLARAPAGPYCVPA